MLQCAVDEILFLFISILSSNKHSSMMMGRYYIYVC